MTADVNSFIQNKEVQDCLQRLRAKYGEHGERLIVSDVLDGDGHQYVNLVQKGGGVLGVALVGYTHVLEEMNIRFIRLAGTSAGAINTALMTVIGGEDANGIPTAFGDKKKAKSVKILEAVCNLNFFDLVDGAGVAKLLIKNFITNAEFTIKMKRWIVWLFVMLGFLLAGDLVLLALRTHIRHLHLLAKMFLITTLIFVVLVTAFILYIKSLVNKLKKAGFGINPGNFFYDWIKKQLIDNGVNTVSDLLQKASTPVADLRLRVDNPAGLTKLEGDVTFIASELVTENKIEFPAMCHLFRKEADINTLQPAGFVRASMSIPFFFESYFIDKIPCDDDAIRRAWEPLGEKNPPGIARFVDGGILSNFPINIFYNPNVLVPRLPSLGIDLDDTLLPEDKKKAASADLIESDKTANKDKSVHPEDWSFGGYFYRMFNTARFYYDKDFLIKNAFYKKGIGTIPLAGYNWLNFFLKDEDKIEMFVRGAKAATIFLETFDWESYKNDRNKMEETLRKSHPTDTTQSVG